MDTKQFHRRVWAMVLLLAMMITIMGATLYDLQINNGKDLYEQTQVKIAETQTIESARGEILDRNGQVLVSNRVIYQVTLDTEAMGENRNDVILSLIQAARAEGVEWTDNLPITKTAPFSFTTTTPFLFTDQDEEGNPVKKLTRLGKLSVELGLIDDPTLDPESEAEAPAPREPSLMDKIKAFLKGGGAQEPPAASQPKGPEPLPNAEQILGRLCGSFGIKGEGAVDRKTAEAAGQTVPELNIGDMSKADARAVAGVLYELYLRSTGVYAANEYVFASDVDIGFISRVKERNLAGVVVEAVTIRQYHTRYAAHLLGRVTPIYPEEVEYYTSLDLDGDGVGDYKMNDTVGRGGAEQAFEAYLRGKPGIRTVERNTKGKIVSENWESEPEPGGNVFLTLDIGLQAYVENLFASVMPQRQELGAEGAACVVLDVNTAEVLTAASYPTFDLSNYGQEVTDKMEDPLTPFVNRAFKGAYPPGSTFKMITAIAGLEERIITTKTKIKDEGRYTFYTPDGPMCWYYRQYGGKHGLIDVSEAIEVSCNYFFFDVGRQLGIGRLDDYASRFGLGEKTGIELEESTGVMASPAYTESHGQTWYDGNTLSVSIGQESTQVTPLQMANYIATLVNGGTRNAAHLLKEVKSSDFSQVVYSYEPQVLGTIDIQDENLEAVKAGMLALTTKGSVRQAFQDLPFRVGAKTGTAQTGGTSSNAHSVFVCFAPYDDPEVAVAMVVEHGEGGGDVSQMCADVLSYYFSSKETREEIPVENTLIR